MLVLGVLLALGAALGFIIGVSAFAGFPSYDPSSGAVVLAVCGALPWLRGSSFSGWGTVTERELAGRRRPPDTSRPTAASA